jgi:hypothetical protein
MVDIRLKILELAAAHLGTPATSFTFDQKQDGYLCFVDGDYAKLTSNPSHIPLTDYNQLHYVAGVVADSWGEGVQKQATEMQRLHALWDAEDAAKKPSA